MNKVLLRRWVQSSNLALFFMDFPAWIEQNEKTASLPEREKLALHQEYEDLFMGTNANIHIPLWYSVCKFDHGCLMDRNTLEVLQLYHKWGYSPVNMDGNPPDYVGQQFRFICYMTASEVYAEGRNLSIEKYEEAIYDFISMYLLDTVRVVADGIRKFSKEAVFLTVADELLNFCGSESKSSEFSELEFADSVLEERLLCYEVVENGAAPAIIPKVCK